MSHTRLQTWQKATALVPLALLSGAWTTSLAVTGTTSAAHASTHHQQPLPDGTSIPGEAIDGPASMSLPGEIAPGVPAGATRSVVSSASTNGIPSAALAAYQRAAEVINQADPSCKIGWQLIAAIGRVESDHGRYGGNTLNADGKSVPGIYGLPLDGSNSTAKVNDTDAGQYDDDPVIDRAVGPMQFIPSTWSVVGVDGDGDDVRDPQDIDDAALASAVYLCSGDEDLSTSAGQRGSVYRYNHSQDYVNLVLSIMNAYVDGDYSSVPNGAAAATVFTPASSGSATSVAGTGVHGPKKAHGAHATDNAGGSIAGASAGGSTGGSPGGSAGGGSTGGGTGGSNGGSNDGTPAPGPTPAPGGGGGGDPVQDATKKATGTAGKVKDTVKDTTDPVPAPSPTTNAPSGATGLTRAQARSRCEAQGVSSVDPAALDSCISRLLG